MTPHTPETVKMMGVEHAFLGRVPLPRESFDSLAFYLMYRKAYDAAVRDPSGPDVRDIMTAIPPSGCFPGPPYEI